MIPLSCKYRTNVNDVTFSIIRLKVHATINPLKKRNEIFFQLFIHENTLE